MKVWAEMSHPEWTQLTVADVCQDERVRLMPNPRAFDGYVEQLVRVSAKSLIHFQCNRYSVPCEWIHAVVSLRAYAGGPLVVGPDGRQVRLARCAMARPSSPCPSHCRNCSVICCATAVATG